MEAEARNEAGDASTTDKATSSDASAEATTSAEAKDAKKAPDEKSKKTGEPPGTLVHGRLAELGAILSGALYCIAFAGFDIWPLTFVCLVPLYLVLIGQTTKRATWLAFLTGL